MNPYRIFYEPGVMLKRRLGWPGTPTYAGFKNSIAHTSAYELRLFSQSELKFTIYKLRTSSNYTANGKKL